MFFGNNFHFNFLTFSSLVHVVFRPSAKYLFVYFKHKLIMADEVDGTTENNEDQKPQKKIAKHDSGAADLEKVTDYAEEKEISGQDITGVNFFACHPIFTPQIN